MSSNNQYLYVQFNYDLYVIIIGIYKDLLGCILVIKPGSFGI